ncbi:hypothetical protein SPRG_08755 [Saprolegnia parasitica CBS 223.65]|uniref:Uncharacterized protein n=1 Tax=Saprolegnia parasitica (strain CBS 223.65) TaxID=695850 RepID=A0A067CG76_SAPPC|nr:hypothetical protein SPRG_08755 [Saprolegnia parasitica CBS 223.65]KDO25812.1 hypothetical protein SPRG_08755 [Saprolegnia parasitica CBS 223.65]|eukprot:XP_012203377.1 hypothetical protein SPRG_08755 [Saprolegnia parasitica CBS 223.65]
MTSSNNNNDHTTSALAVLTNTPLLQLVCAYQDGLTPELSSVFLMYRRRMQRSLVPQKKQILAKKDMFRGHVALKLVEKGDVAMLYELERQIPTGYARPPRNESSYVYGINTAAARGQLDVVRFLHQHDLAKCSKKAMDDAASNGDLAMVTYLDKHRNEGCSLAGYILAEKHGHRDVVEYLLAHRPQDQNKCPPSDPQFVLHPLLSSAADALAKVPACGVQ